MPRPVTNRPTNPSTGMAVAQNAAKERENEMQRSELADIAGWVERQRALFASYYEELREVKQVIAGYEAVKRMIDKQAGIIAGYRQAYAVLRQDGHFTGEEMDHAYRVLSGIAGQSAANVKRLWVVVTSLVTQMDDGARLRLIDETGKEIDGNYGDLAAFSQQHFLLSLQRAKDARDMAVIKALYGIQ